MNEWTHRHQLEIKEHINEVARKKSNQADTLYETKKKAFVKEHLEKKTQETRKTLEPLIKKFEESIKNLESKAEDINYLLGYPDFEYKIPQVKSDKIESALEKDFDKKNHDKLEQAENTIEQKPKHGGNPQA